MAAILKWNVPVDDNYHPIGSGEVVHVGSQWGKRDEIQVWTKESGNVGETRRIVQVYGTGHTIPSDAKPLGTVIAAGGHLVWHLCELRMEKFNGGVL